MFELLKKTTGVMPFASMHSIIAPLHGAQHE